MNRYYGVESIYGETDTPLSPFISFYTTEEEFLTVHRDHIVAIERYVYPDPWHEPTDDEPTPKNRWGCTITLSTGRTAEVMTHHNELLSYLGALDIETPVDAMWDEGRRQWREYLEKKDQQS